MSCIGGFAPETATRNGLSSAWAMKLSAFAPMMGQQRRMHTRAACDAEAYSFSRRSDASLSSLYWKPAVGRAGVSSLMAGGLPARAPYTLVLLR